MTREIPELSSAIKNPNRALRLQDVDILPAGMSADITIGSVKIIRWVAAGSTGQIYEGRTRNGTSVAIKVMVTKVVLGDEFHPEVCATREVQCSEGARLASLDKDANVVRLLAQGPLTNLRLSKKFHEVYNIGRALIFEWCDAGDLDTVVDNCARNRIFIPEGLIWKWLIEIVSVSRILSAPFLEKGVFMCDIIHDDIKPDNIFLTFAGNDPAKSWPSIKVGDFGFAQPILSPTGRMTSTNGLAPHSSPQWPMKSVKSELWEFVHAIYMVCTIYAPAKSRDLPKKNPKDDPFRMNDRYSKAMFERHGGDVKIWRIPACYSDDLQTFFEWVLNPNESQRPDPEEVIQALEEINATDRASKFVPLPRELFMD